MERNIYKIGKELFITNDEEIKEGDWFMSDFNSFPIHNIKELSEREGTLSWEQKDLKNNLKIILTTDDLLIKDGVQAIDDEFLEWFVKNTCCEFVKTTNYFEEFGKMDLIKYKIIIPKEEPKQEARVFGGKDNKIFWIDKPVQKGHPDYKETPEEAALRLYPKIITDPYNPFEDLLEEERDIFVNGAKWQQEDILELLKVNGYEDEPIFDLITEQFKKK
jgi:hypothetical protein